MTYAEKKAKVAHIKEGDRVRVVSNEWSAPVGTVGVAEWGNDFPVPCMGMRDDNGNLWSFYDSIGLEVIEEEVAAK